MRCLFPVAYKPKNFSITQIRSRAKQLNSRLHCTIASINQLDAAHKRKPQETNNVHKSIILIYFFFSQLLWSNKKSAVKGVSAFLREYIILSTAGVSSGPSSWTSRCSLYSSEMLLCSLLSFADCHARKNIDIYKAKAKC